MSQEDIFINGELLRLRREARGWVLSDLATRACMSVKQIRQLEEGGMSSFYSAAVKMTSAKKVGALLGLSAAEVFAHEVEHVPDQEAVDPEYVVVEPQVLANENTPNEVASVVYESAQVEVDTTEMHPSVLKEAPAKPTSVADDSKSKTSLWVIVGLFAAALAVAAYMQPKDEPVAEAAPPLQVLPADLTDAASAASSAEGPASSAEVLVSPASAASTSANMQKTASSSASISSPPRTAVQMASGAAPVTVRPASAIMASPASSAVSKAP